MNSWKILLAALVLTFTAACTKDDTITSNIDEAEAAQQVGDSMASIDEAGGSTGSLSLYLKSESKIFARRAPQQGSLLEGLLWPKADAASCVTTNTWGTCANNVITRTFGGCSAGSTTFDGTVQLTFNDGVVDNTCHIGVGNNITRNPNFTITGRRGGILAVVKTGAFGQKLTQTSTGVYNFENDGINRSLAIEGTEIANFTTTTTSTIGVTGAARSGRVINGGTLHVVNNLTASSCDFSPTNVTWTNSCSCPSEGSWSGSCSDGKTSSITMTGCGTATVVFGSNSQSVVFDRCYNL